MLIPSKNRKAIYEYLFNEGVAVAKKDFNLKQHPNIPGVTNLEVIKALKACSNSLFYQSTYMFPSLASRELVKEQFAWRHYYWYLTDEGIAHLREVLNLPAEIVPSTVKSKPRDIRAPTDIRERIPRAGWFSSS
ncbi:Plectin/S10 domain protein [Cooperia oncophora]